MPRSETRLADAGQRAEPRDGASPKPRLSWREPPPCKTCRHCVPRITLHGRTYLNACRGGVFANCEADRTDIWPIAAILGTCGKAGRHWEPLDAGDAPAVTWRERTDTPALLVMRESRARRLGTMRWLLGLLGLVGRPAAGGRLAPGADATIDIGP